mmetsp:Transcript_7230/g.23747  ORF Transcript_7230/g.23747 Transcript_7230/m.23747 type:complete len:165 (+) Transcript_7230:78-572(+)
MDHMKLEVESSGNDGSLAEEEKTAPPPRPTKPAPALSATGRHGLLKKTFSDTTAAPPPSSSKSSSKRLFSGKRFSSRTFKLVHEAESAMNSGLQRTKRVAGWMLTEFATIFCFVLWVCATLIVWQHFSSRDSVGFVVVSSHFSFVVAARGDFVCRLSYILALLL